MVNMVIWFVIIKKGEFTEALVTYMINDFDDNKHKWNIYLSVLIKQVQYINYNTLKLLI